MLDEIKQLLLEEKKEVEETLSGIGQKMKVGHVEEWEPKFPDMNPLASEKSELADEVEEFDNRIGVETDLEHRLSEINQALERVSSGTYGKCEVGGEEIPYERLRANPAARTCIEHSKPQ